MRKGSGRIYDEWSFVTQIFHSRHPSHGSDRKTFEEMTST